MCLCEHHQRIAGWPSDRCVLRTEYHPSTVRCLAIPSEYKILRARPRAVPSAVLARSPPLFIFRDGLFDCTRRVAAVGCTLTFFCASCIAVVSGVGSMPVGIRSTAFRMFPRRHRPSYTDANLRALTTSYRTPCVPCCERCRGAHRVGRTIKSTRRPQKMARGPRLGKLPIEHVKHNQNKKKKETLMNLQPRKWGREAHAPSSRSAEPPPTSNIQECRSIRVGPHMVRGAFLLLT